MALGIYIVGVLRHVVGHLLNLCVETLVVLGLANTALATMLVTELASGVVAHLLLEALLVGVSALLAAARHDTYMLFVLAQVDALADHFGIRVFTLLALGCLGRGLIVDLLCG